MRNAMNMTGVLATMVGISRERLIPHGGNTEKCYMLATS
jgi:hypothetical protein